MRIRVAGDPSPDARLTRALAGLEQRGHTLLMGGRGDADVAVGAGSPVRLAHAGWRSRARAMVLACDAERLRRWGPFEHLAWGTLWSLAIVPDSDREALQAAMGPDGVHGLAADRVALWSGAPVPAAADPTGPDVDVLERACERAVARGHAAGGRGALFLDRDGTLVVERGYLSDPDGLELLPGVVQALREARAGGLALVVISNQAGVGRGLFPLRRVHETMAGLRRMLRAEGVELDAVRFCPHRPDAGCECRKPGPRLLVEAAEDLALSLPRSVMIGDRWLDVGAGHAAGASGVLVRTGYGREEEARVSEAGVPEPDRICDTLLEAVRWFLERMETHPVD